MSKILLWEKNVLLLAITCITLPTMSTIASAEDVVKLICNFNGSDNKMTYLVNYREGKVNGEFAQISDEQIVFKDSKIDSHPTLSINRLTGEFNVYDNRTIAAKGKCVAAKQMF